MDIEIKKRFSNAWEKYFPGSELPIVCFYSNELGDVPFPDHPKPNKKGYTCLFSQIAPVKQGRSRAFNITNLGCFGSFLPLGFDINVSDDVKNYICNIERVKKSYAHVDSMYKHRPPQQAPGKYLIFKRWDNLEKEDTPQVVIFFVTPDVIAGLHGLANFDTMTPYSVIAPFGTACDAIVGFPLSELESEDPKAVLGSMDPSARIYFKPNISTFAAPWPKFLSMLENMDDSFLDTVGWSKVKSRSQKVR